MAREKDESVVYRQLAGSGLTAGNVGNAKFSQNIEGVRDGLVLAFENDQNFHDLKTVNDASFRTGNDAIPGTFQFATATFVDNGTDVILTPKVGEIWRLYLPIARVTNITGTVSYTFNLQNTSDSTEYQFYFHSSGSSTPRLNEDTAWDGEWIEIGHGMAIEAKVSNFAADLVQMGFVVARVK